MSSSGGGNGSDGLVSRVVEQMYERYVGRKPAYLGLIERIHEYVAPRTYVEIGVATGATLALALPGTRAIGVDPAPRIKVALAESARVFEMTSDEFFAGEDLDALLGHQPVDLSFIDGMHHFEYALRDFMNVERYSNRDTAVLIHDCNPVDEITQRRDRETSKWTGDIWKVVVCLKEWRPDLRICVVDTPPSGLAIVRGLDPTSKVLSEHYDEIVDHYIPLPYTVLEEVGRRESLNLVPYDWDALAARLPYKRRQGFSVDAYKAKLAISQMSPPALRRAHAKANRAGKHLRAVLGI
jgi:Methyltransferase domain